MGRKCRAAVHSAIASCVLMLAGCTAHDSVEATWGDNMAKLGIDPVYPPNAMLSPGQVDVTPQAPNGASRSDVYARRSIKLGHIDLRDALLREAMTRIELPDTSAPPAEKGIWSRATSPNIFAPPSIEAAAGKAPLLVLPGFEIARGTAADFAAVAPLKFVSAAFGGGFGQDTTITVSVPAAEVLGVSVTAATAEQARYCAQDFATRTGMLPDDATVAKFDFCHPETMIGGLWRNEAFSTAADSWFIRYVYQVYYARAIKFHYASTAYADLASKIQLLDATSLANQGLLLSSLKAGTTPPGTTPPAVTTTPPTDAASTFAAQLKLASQVQSNIDAALASPVPGSSLHLSGYAADGVDLEQVFEQPVAIGYRALYIPIRADGPAPATEPGTTVDPGRQAPERLRPPTPGLQVKPADMPPRS